MHFYRVSLPVCARLIRVSRHAWSDRDIHRYSRSPERCSRCSQEPQHPKIASSLAHGSQVWAETHHLRVSGKEMTMEGLGKDAKTSSAHQTPGSVPTSQYKTGCHAPLLGSRGTRLPLQRPSRSPAPHPRAPAAQGAARGPWRAAFPPAAAPSRCSGGAASPWRLRHARARLPPRSSPSAGANARDFRVAHAQERKLSGGGAGLESRPSGKGGRSGRGGAHFACGRGLLHKGAGPRRA